MWHSQTIDIKEWSDLVRAEYLEMPGLCLTKAQVQRLWNFDPITSEGVLSNLLSAGFLRRTARDEYVLAARRT